MKDRCVISSGLIQMTAVGGASLLVALAIHLDKTSRRLSIITTASRSLPGLISSSWRVCRTFTRLGGGGSVLTDPNRL